MNPKVICILLCISSILLTVGCSKNTSGELSAEETAIRAVADPAVMEKYALEDLEDYRIHAYNAPNGSSYARYELQLCGYNTYDFINVELASDGTILNIYDTLGNYIVFVDRVKPSDVWWAKLRLLGNRIRYFDEETYSYYLTIDRDGNLCLSLEIIDHFKSNETNENGNAQGGCGLDHEHLFFSKVICPAP